MAPLLQQEEQAQFHIHFPARRGISRLDGLRAAGGQRRRGFAAHRSELHHLLDSRGLADHAAGRPRVLWPLHQLFSTLDGFQLTPPDVRITPMPQAPTTDLKSLPRIQVVDFTTLFAAAGGDLFTWNTDNQWTLAPSLSMTRGRHTLRTGGEVVYYARGAVAPGYGTGTFAFNSGWTQQFPDVRRNGL